MWIISPHRWDIRGEKKGNGSRNELYLILHVHFSGGDTLSFHLPNADTAPLKTWLGKTHNCISLGLWTRKD